MGFVFVPGKSHAVLITSDIDVGNVTSIDLAYLGIRNVFNPTTYCVWPGCNLRVSSVVVSQMSHYPES